MDCCNIIQANVFLTMFELILSLICTAQCKARFWWVLKSCQNKFFIKTQHQMTFLRLDNFRKNNVCGAGRAEGFPQFLRNWACGNTIAYSNNSNSNVIRKAFPILFNQMSIENWMCDIKGIWILKKIKKKTSLRIVW